MQPEAFLTVNVYDPASRPVIVLVVPVPVVIIPPGDLVIVHVPVAGNPLNATLPVERAHVGCVIVPTTGGVGVGGWAVITTLADEAEIQTLALVTVKV